MDEFFFNHQSLIISSRHLPSHPFSHPHFLTRPSRSQKADLTQSRQGAKVFFASFFLPLRLCAFA